MPAWGKAKSKTTRYATNLQDYISQLKHKACLQPSSEHHALKSFYLGQYLELPTLRLCNHLKQVCKRQQDSILLKKFHFSTPKMIEPSFSIGYDHFNSETTYRIFLQMLLLH